MPFSEETVKKAWDRAKGHCESCDKELVLKNKGRSGKGAWEAHHRSKTGGDGLSNCKILCWDCHLKTM